MPSSKITVLVVDDEASIRELVTEKLRAAGYDTLDASSGPEALETCVRHSGKIDVLLTDLIMPGMTGRALMDAMLARGMDIPVIFMSGFIDELRSEAMQQDVPFVHKPINWERLSATIRDSVKNHKKTI